MALPKVKFEVFDISENLDNLVWYLNEENSKNSPLNFYEFTLDLFPTLKDKITTDMNDEKRYLILEKEVKPILEELSKNSKDILKYQKAWDEVNDKIMQELENKLEIKWKEDTKITCQVGLLPVCPRDIMGRTFVINYGISEEKMIATAIHEICHFLYFEKWKELFPNFSEDEFDFPHIAWYLSEAMIDPLINNATFKKYTKDDLEAYSVFYETYIDGKSVIDTLRDYVQNNPIDVAIKKGYDFFQKYKDKIKNN